MDQVGCCRQVHARLPHPRLCECGTLTVGVPTGESRFRKFGGLPPQGTRAPSGGGTGNDSEGQKQAVLGERPTKPLPPTHSPGMAPLSPFYPALWARTELVWSRGLSLLQTQLYTTNGTPRHSGRDTLTLWGVRRGDTGPFARLGRGGLRLVREDTVAFPQEPAE